MTQVRRATTKDTPMLLPLVAAYWHFERISGFAAERVSAQLERLLSDPNLGACWVALANDDTPVGYLLAVYVFSLEHAGLTAEIDEFFVARTGAMPGLARSCSGLRKPSSGDAHVRMCPCRYREAMTRRGVSISVRDTRRDRVTSCSRRRCMRGSCSTARRCWLLLRLRARNRIGFLSGCSGAHLSGG